MARYGSGDDETVITEYLDAHLEGGIKQKNLDLVLDLMDEFVELKESVEVEINEKTESTSILGSRQILNSLIILLLLTHSCKSAKLSAK